MNRRSRRGLISLVSLSGALLCVTVNATSVDSICPTGTLDLGDGVCLPESEICYLDKKIGGCDDGDVNTQDACVAVGVPGAEIFGSCLHTPVELGEAGQGDQVSDAFAADFVETDSSERTIEEFGTLPFGCQNSSPTSVFGLLAACFALIWRRRR